METTLVIPPLRFLAGVDQHERIDSADLLELVIHESGAKHVVRSCQVCYQLVKKSLVDAYIGKHMAWDTKEEMWKLLPMFDYAGWRAAAIPIWSKLVGKHTHIRDPKAFPNFPRFVKWKAVYKLKEVSLAAYREESQRWRAKKGAYWICEDDEGFPTFFEWCYRHNISTPGQFSVALVRYNVEFDAFLSQEMETYLATNNLLLQFKACVTKAVRRAKALKTATEQASTTLSEPVDTGISKPTLPPGETPSNTT